MDIAALKAAAEVASPGEWTLGGSTKQRVEIGNLTVAFFGESMSFGVDGSFSITREEAAANAAFVALANPTSILSMIARLEALEEALRTLVDEYVKRGGAFDEPCGESEQTPEINAAIRVLRSAS